MQETPHHHHHHHRLASIQPIPIPINTRSRSPVSVHLRRPVRVRLAYTHICTSPTPIRWSASIPSHVRDTPHPIFIFHLRPLQLDGCGNTASASFPLFLYSNFASPRMYS